MRSRFIIGVLLAVALGTAGAWWLRRETATTLRVEISLGREQRDELTRARTENARVRAAQLPAEELARLRADHAAVVRLRQEIGSLKEGLEKRERALQTVPSSTSSSPLGGHPGRGHGLNHD